MSDQEIQHGFTLQSVVVSLNADEKVVHYNKRLGAMASEEPIVTVVQPSGDHKMTLVDAVIHIFSVLLLIDFLFQPLV